MKRNLSLLIFFQLIVVVVSAQSNVFPDIILTSPDYPKIDFNGRILYRGVGGNNLTWRYDGVNDGVLIHSANFNSYTPSLTGAGASGNWNINAASANNATLWKGNEYDPNIAGAYLGYLMGYNSNLNKWTYYHPEHVRLWLGIPSGGETLQSISDRDNNTSNGLRVTAAAKLTGGPAVELYYGDNAGNLAAYDRNASVFKPLFIQAQHTSFPNGSVGIGTTSPAEKLHVMGNSRSEGQIRFYTPYPDAGGASGIVANPNGWTRIDPNGGRFIMTVFKEDVEASRNILDIERVDTWQKLMELRADGSGFFQGNIGIGTSAPQSKLAVNGDITTKKIKVTLSGWPDYVFDSSYQLPSLSHIETFIQQNKHLPEVPSAAEVKKNGLDLGDNQVLLLKKIEELTLYIIQQNKEMQEVKKELQVLKAGREEILGR